jgi:transcriptional regulator with XRE-family HTH domain
LNSYFPRIITLLRKERGLSQKSVAESLGVSQALLSHYEKGIRECGLDFVVKIADFYGVSSDYLLGRAANPSGIPILAPQQPACISHSAQVSAEQRLLVNAITLLYSVLENCKNENLAKEASTYLFASFYRAFRTLYASNPKNPEDLFAVRKELAGGYSAACAEVALSNLACLLSGKDIGSAKGLDKSDTPTLSPKELASAYPDLAPSLFSLIRQIELQMDGSTSTKKQKPQV